MKYSFCSMGLHTATVQTIPQKDHPQGWIVTVQPGWETFFGTGAVQTQVSCFPGVPLDSGTPQTGRQQVQI